MDALSFDFKALEAAFSTGFDILTKLVALASAVAAVTPTPADDTWVGKAYRVIDWMALNVGMAKDLPGERARTQTKPDAKN